MVSYLLYFFLLLTAAWEEVEGPQDLAMVSANQVWVVLLFFFLFSKFFFFFFNFLEPHRGFGRFGMGEFGCVLGIGDLVDCGLGKGILEGFGRCRQYPVKGLGGDEAAVRVFFFLDLVFG